MSFFKSFLFTAALAIAPSNTSAQLLANWDLNFLSMDTDFSVTGTDELVLHYEIGKDRVYDIALFDKGCVNPIEGINVTFVDTKTPFDDVHDKLDIALDVERSNIATSNLWNAFTNKFEMCLRLQLLSGDMVIKEDARDISILFEFAVDFADIVGLGSVQKTSGIGSTTVDSYVAACKCSDISTFECDDNMLMPSQELYLCVRSTSPDINIDSLHSLMITQGPEAVLIIDGNTVQDESISAKYDVPEHNGVAVAMLVPAAFWQTGGMGTQISLSGTVFLKLVNSRRLVTASPSIGYSRGLLSRYEKMEQASRDFGELLDDKLDAEVDDDTDGDADVSSFQVQVDLRELEEDSGAFDSSHRFLLLILFLPIAAVFMM